MATVTDLTVYQGEAATLNFTMNPVLDISGWSLLFTVARSQGSKIKDLSKAPQIISGPAGTFKVVLTTDDVDDLVVGSHYYDVWRMDTGNERVLALGKFTVAGVARLPQ